MHQGLASMLARTIYTVLLRYEGEQEEAGTLSLLGRKPCYGYVATEDRSLIPYPYYTTTRTTASFAFFLATLSITTEARY